MSEASLSSIAPESAAAPRLRRSWRHGLRHLYEFVFRTGGLESAYEATFALAGPAVQRELDRFAQDEIGRQLLAERPRRDLNQLLADRERLSAMPKGSFADAYLEYMGGQDMGTADFFVQAADLEEKAARFGWSEDQLWFVRRMTNSHDLFHVIAGYDRDIVGEVGVDAYTAGQIPLVALRLLLLYFFFLKPSSPVAWTSYVLRAYRHGRATPNLACIDYEAMLALPLDEVRRKIGAKTVQEAHPDGLPRTGKTLRRLERRIKSS